MIKNLFITLYILFISMAVYPQINPFEYFPLKENLRWDYVYNSNSSAYKEVKKVDSNRVYFYYDFKLFPNSYSNFITFVYKLSSDTLYLIPSGTYLFEETINIWEKPLIFFISPMKVGEKVISENDYGQTYEFEFINIYNEVEILDSIYTNVIEIKSKFDDNHITFSYYAKGIGLIKEVQIIDSDRKTILELKNYSLFE